MIQALRARTRIRSSSVQSCPSLGRIIVQIRGSSHSLVGRDNALGVASVKAPQPLDALGAQPLFTETGQQSPADHLYYSFTTLTTTGYGDLTTESDVGRAASILEALVGQIYLVTVVAGIVANLRPRR